MLDVESAGSVVASGSTVVVVDDDDVVEPPGTVVVDDVDVDDEVLDVELGSVVEVLDVDELDVEVLDVDDVDDELVVGHGIDVVTNGGRVVGTTAGTVVVLRNGGFVVEVVVDGDDVLDDVDDVDDGLDDEVVMMCRAPGAPAGDATAASGRWSRCRGPRSMAAPGTSWSSPRSSMRPTTSAARGLPAAACRFLRCAHPSRGRA